MNTNRVLALTNAAYVSIPSAPKLQNPTEMTIEAWVYERSYRFSSCLLDFGNAQDADNLVWKLALVLEGKDMEVMYGHTGAFERGDIRDGLDG